MRASRDVPLDVAQEQVGGAPQALQVALDQRGLLEGELAKLWFCGYMGGAGAIHPDGHVWHARLADDGTPRLHEVRL